VPRKPAGELSHGVDGWSTRITLSGTRRRTYQLVHARTEPEARERSAALAALAVRFRNAGREGETSNVLLRAAQTPTGKHWEVFLEAVDDILSGRTAGINTQRVPTFAAFALSWTSGELAKSHPDHVREKDAERDETQLRGYVYPVIGHLPLDQVTLDQCDEVLRRLPSRLSRASRRHVAQVVSRVLRLAVYPARHLKQSPIPTGWLPKIKGRKAFDFLYPEEDVALMGAASVPLPRRLLYGFLAREGMRLGEALGLRWRHLDLERGFVILDKNKTDDPRRWSLGADVVAALRLWRDNFREDTTPNANVFTAANGGLVPNHAGLSRLLRVDLGRAGITRPSLFERSATRSPLRVHDLRATFITLALATGRSETWVTDRTGHTSSQMVARYKRGARAHEEGNVGWLAALDEAIPELRVPPSKPRGNPAPSPDRNRAAAAPRENASGSKRLRSAPSRARTCDRVIRNRPPS
jgi:integrase